MAKGCDHMKKAIKIMLIAMICILGLFWLIVETNPDFAVQFGLASGPGKPDAIAKEAATTPTGYPSGEVQQPQILYDGLLYYYFATGFAEPLPAGYESIGNVEAVDNENTPTSDYHGARVEPGQEIYVLPGIHDAIYVKYENGYARFSLKQEAENQTGQDAVAIPTCSSMEAAIADDFIDPSTVSVLGGEWAYTVDPDRFVALVSVKYRNKFDEYETAEYVVLGEFGGDAGTRHCLNQHSPYTRETVLEIFGAINNQRFALV